MKKNKILFIDSVVTAGSIRKGIAGGEVRLAEIIKGFIEREWEAHLLTNGGGELFCKHFGLDGVVNHNFGFRGGKSRLWFIIFTVKVMFKLPDSLRNFNGHVYTANELLFDVVPALKLKAANKNKWVAVVHWMPPLKFWQRKESRFFTSLLFMLQEHLCVFLIRYLANIVLAVSKPTREQLLQAGVREDKVIAVNCGVNFKEISGIAKDNLAKKFEAVFMKRIQAVKGVFDLINIWELVVKKKPDAKLAIIGGGIDNRQVVSLIKERQLESSIVFFGPIFDFKKKFKIIAQSQMFILPSYEENWAIVMGEAMACKIPVLAYNLQELIGVWQNSFVPVALGNKQLFADKINHYLNNQVLRDKQAELGYQYVQQFEWSNIAQNEVNLVRSI